MSKESRDKAIEYIDENHYLDLLSHQRDEIITAIEIASRTPKIKTTMSNKKLLSPKEWLKEKYPNYKIAFHMPEIFNIMKGYAEYVGGFYLEFANNE